MYKSPIEVFQTGIEYQLENDIMNMIQKYGTTVNRDELIKTLRYDRDQYDKGYADGKRDAIDELVRCKDCKYWKEYSVCNLDNFDPLKELLRDAPIQSLGVGECCCKHWNTLEKPIMLPQVVHIECHETNKNDFCSYAERKETDE